MSKVYVVQKQLVQVNGELVNKFDLTTAQAHGELVYLLGPTAGPFNSRSVITELRTKLAEFTTEDHLLLLGNPCLIGWATALAARQSGGALSLLQWSSREQRYVLVKSQL